MVALKTAEAAPATADPKARRYKKKYRNIIIIGYY